MSLKDPAARKSYYKKWYRLNREARLDRHAREYVPHPLPFRVTDCEECHSPFHTQWPQQRFCSESCKQQAKRTRFHAAYKVEWREANRSHVTLYARHYYRRRRRRQLREIQAQEGVL